jgi:hypothetical protein
MPFIPAPGIHQLMGESEALILWLCKSYAPPANVTRVVAVMGRRNECTLRKPSCGNYTISTYQPKISTSSLILCKDVVRVMGLLEMILTVALLLDNTQSADGIRCQGKIDVRETSEIRYVPIRTRSFHYQLISR